MAMNLTEIWYKAATSGKITLEGVPEKYREAVRKLLEKDDA